MKKAGQSAGSGAWVFISGRLGSLILIFAFNFILLRIAGTMVYAQYALLLAVGSVANTLASFGAQRLVPRLVGESLHADLTRSRRRLMTLFLVRAIGVAVVSAALFLASSEAVFGEVRIARHHLLAFVVLSVVTAVNQDTEAASQTLGRQVASRRIILSDWAVRCCAVIIVEVGSGALHLEDVLAITILSQSGALIVLGSNCWRWLRRSGALEVGEVSTAQDVRSIALAGYLGGLAWLATSPAVIRVVAASLLPATGVAALAFVQSLTASVQRFTPGFLMQPFLEARMMGASAERQTTQNATGLGLAWKIDALLCWTAVAFACLLGPIFMQLVGKAAFAPFWIFFPALLVPVFLNTLYRSLEIWAVAGNRAARIWYSAIVAIPTSLVLYYSRWIGVELLFLVPIVDAVVRCCILGWPWLGREKTPVAQFAKPLAALALASLLAIGPLMLAGSLPSWVAPLLAGAYAVLVTVLLRVGIFTDDEVAIASAAVPARMRKWLPKITRQPATSP